MTYAVLADLNAQFGDAEILMLTDRNMDGIPDTVLVASALQRASDRIDSYLAARYALPLTVVSNQLVDICCDITRYLLCGSAATETEVARERYKDAIKRLEHIRDGKVDIGLTLAGQSTDDIPSVNIIGGGRTFSRDNLADY